MYMSRLPLPNYVPGVGPKNPDLMFVGEAPGRSENFLGYPFVERDGEYSAGSLLNSILREIGINRRDVYITNVVKYQPPENKLRRLEEIGIKIEDQVAQLWDEINAIKPNCIVTMGNLALKAVFGKGNGYKGIMQWRGSYLPTAQMDYKGVATIHPAALLHRDGELEDDRFEDRRKKGSLTYSYRHVLKLDLLKAKRESNSKLYDPPQRVLEIARDHVALQRFLEQYSNKSIVSVDIEVRQAVPFCISLAFNDWHAISVPILDCFGWQGQEGPSESVRAEMLCILAQFLDSGISVIGQNFKFDQRQLARLCGIRIKHFYCDTSLLAHSLHPEFPKSLAFTTSIYTREPYYKDEGKEFNPARDKIEKYLQYNARDAAVTFEVFTAMMRDACNKQVKGFPNWRDDFVLGHQMALHNFYYDLEDVGFRVDRRRQSELYDLYSQRIIDAEEELDTIAGWHVNVNAKAKGPSKLVYQQLGFPLRTGTSEEVLFSLIANHTHKRPPSHKRALELILYIRKLRLNRKKVFGAKPDYDGRMRTVYTITGTETGRSSTKVLKPPVRPEILGMPFHVITKHGEIGVEGREFLIPDDGYVLVETDMSQAEARIVALLGLDHKLLRMFENKEDIHSITAGWIFNVPLSEVSKELRFIGKTVRHAGHYDMREHRLTEIVNTDAKKYGINIAISQYKAGIILNKFHRFSPNIREVFHESVQRALRENNRQLTNPFGRIRQFFNRWGRELFKEAYTQIPQSTVPDQLRGAGIRAKRRFTREGVDARFVVEAHDALVGLVLKRDVDAYKSILHEEIERPIDFSRCTIKRDSLVIPAESKVGYNYRECPVKKCTNMNCLFLHDYERWRTNYAC
jgi:uracil-DNA glycosylase family 4